MQGLSNISPSRRLLILLAFLAVVSTHRSPGSWNDRSRIATVQSLVESRSFIIDETDFIDTGDKVFINGHFYSDKMPMPSVLGAAVYLPLYRLGIRLQRGPSLAYYLVTLLTVKLSWLLGSLAFFSMLRFTGLGAERRFLASLILSLGSLYFSWSTTFNNHELAASFLCIGFFLILKARYEGNVERSLAGAGLFLSLAGTIDVPTAIFYVGFLLYLLREPWSRAGIAAYLLPLLVTLLPAIAMNYSLHESVLPVASVPAHFEYAGSRWSGPSALQGSSVNDLSFVLRYSFLALVGPRGFFLYNPFLWIAVGGIAGVIRSKEEFFCEAVVIASCSLAVLTYYLMTTYNFSGWSYSVRYFVPLLPLLFFFLYPYLAALDKKHAGWFWSLLVVSIFVAMVGALNPWSNLSLSSVPLIANLLEVFSM